MLGRFLSLFLVSLLFKVKDAAGAASNFKLNTDLSISSATKDSYQSIFCGYNVRAAYTGPVIKLRKGSIEQDFYGSYDLTTAYGGGGQTLQDWLGVGVTKAFVVIWYDQSGYGRHATQTNQGLQPYFDVNERYVDFKPTNFRLNLPGTIFPAGNAPFSFVLQHGSIAYRLGVVFAVGNMADNQANAFRKADGGYVHYWWGNDYGLPTGYAPANIVSETNNGVSRTLYVNGVAAAPLVATLTRNYVQTNGYIGYNTHSYGQEPIQGEVYFLLTSNIVIPDADRIQLETGAAAAPVENPTAAPSVLPSFAPSAAPSVVPSAKPTATPSVTPSSAPSEAPTLAVPEYSLTVSAKSFKYFEVRVFTEANERVFPVSYDLVDCPENAGAVIWGHESTPVTENTNTCVFGLPRHYWCECPALVNGNKPKLTLNFGGTVFDRVELLILDWMDGEVVVRDSANNIVLFSASRAGGPLVGEEFVGYDHLNLLQVAPTVVPTVVPSSVPTTKPSWTPTTKPTIPSIVPTQTPTMAPTTTVPSAEPSVTPSAVPSAAPSFTAQYTITMTAKTFKYFEVRVYTHDNLRIFPVSYELEHCPENAGVAVWNEQTTEDTNTCVYGYPRNFWCQCAAVADEKPKLVLHMGHTVFDRVELLLLNWEDGEVTVTDEANHETFLSATHDGVGNEFVTFGNLNLEHAAAPVRRLLRGNAVADKFTGTFDD